MLKKLLLILLISLLSSNTVFAQDCDITVKPNQNIQKDGINKAKSGETVCVEYGTYKEALNFEGKNSIALLGIQNSNGQNPLLDGQAGVGGTNKGYPLCQAGCSNNDLFRIDPRSGKGFVFRGLVRINKSSQITIKNLDITNSMGGGVTTGESSQTVLDNVNIYENRHAAVRFHNSTNNTFRNSRVYHNANFATYSRPSSVTNWPIIINGTHRTSKDNVFENLTVFENWGEGIEPGPGSKVQNSSFYNNYALQVYLGSKNVLFENNLLYVNNSLYYRNGEASTCIYFNEEHESPGDRPENIQVKNNIVVGCGLGIRVGGNETQKGLKNVSISNNTFVNNDSFLATTNLNHEQVLYENNIIFQKNGKFFKGNVGRFTFNNNIFNKTFQEIPSNSIVDTSRIFQGFNPSTQTSIKAKEYEPSRSSQAVDAGKKSSLERDFFGCLRDNKPDIGAIEFNGTDCNKENPQPPPPPELDFDFNNDGVEDLKDVVLLVKEILGEGKIRFDADGNGVVDVKDAVVVIKKLFDI